jgi:hypothetical protein
VAKSVVSGPRQSQKCEDEHGVRRPALRFAVKGTADSAGRPEIFNERGGLNFISTQD